ncbi:MAG: helix-turn-helix domain-containing protein [Luteolibacter sp.]
MKVSGVEPDISNQELNPQTQSEIADSTNGIAAAIGRLSLYHRYVRSFICATGLPLRLLPADGSRTVQSSTYRRNKFCEMLSPKNQTCASCMLTLRKLTATGNVEPATWTCFAGLCESSVPIRSGEKTIAYLATGEVAIHKLTQARFSEILYHLKESGVHANETELRHAYFATPVISPAQYGSALDLLAIFAEQLAQLVNQLEIHQDTPEALNISKAREFIRQHLSEPLDLKTVADQAHLSSCYFCKKFKETTGLTLTGYISRTRVEAAKNLLIQPSTRISEVAYEVGFQSLTHFNRVFREITGQSPTQYRKGLPGMELKNGAHQVQ